MILLILDAFNHYQSINLVHKNTVCAKYRNFSSGSSMDGWGGLKRGGADCRRSRPGEGAGGGTPPAQLGGMGNAVLFLH